MKTLDFTPFTEEQFQQLAMYKARGNSWVEIAAYVNLPVEQIQRVAWTHEKQWERTLAKAERHVARETIGEVVDMLRKDMRHADSKARPTIANSLTRAIKQQQAFAPKKRPRPIVMPVPTPTPPPAPKPTDKPLPPLLPLLPPLEPLDPLEPKLTLDEERARFKRAKATLEAICGMCLVVLCFLGMLLSRAMPASQPTLGPIVTASAVVEFVEPSQAIAMAPPDEEGKPPILHPLAVPWRAPPDSA